MHVVPIPPSTPSGGPPPNQPAPPAGHGQAKLDALAEALERCDAPDGGHTLLHVVDLGEDVELGVRHLPPGEHPFAALAGFSAPAHWWAVGVRATGRAHHLEEEGRDPSPTTVTFLAARTGEEASVLRIDGEARLLSDRAEGTLADLCRRVLGRPTSPAPPSRAALWTAIWLDRVMAAWSDPAQRGDLLRSWAAVAARHPAHDHGGDGRATADRDELIAAGRALAERWTWADLRSGARAVPLPDGELPPHVAAWMDDGFYARWTLGAFPPLATLAVELRHLLGPDHGPELAATVVGLLT